MTQVRAAYRRITVGAKSIPRVKYEDSDQGEIEVSHQVKVNGKRVGSYYSVLYPDRGVANIVEFHIDEQYRGKGLGLQTAKELVKELNRKGYGVRVDSEEDTVEFWKKVGFYEGESSGGGVWMTQGR